jgi:hypothetical protein
MDGKDFSTHEGSNLGLLRKPLPLLALTKILGILEMI